MGQWPCTCEWEGHLSLPHSLKKPRKHYQNLKLSKFRNLQTNKQNISWTNSFQIYIDKLTHRRSIALFCKFILLYYNFQEFTCHGFLEYDLAKVWYLGHQIPCQEEQAGAWGPVIALLLPRLWMVAYATAIQYDWEDHWLLQHELGLELEVVDKLHTS